MSEAEQGTMAVETIERVALLTEAAAIEAAGGDWRISHVCAVLDCHRSSLYRSRWLKSRMIRGPGGVRMRPRDVRLFQQLQTAGSALQRAN